MASCTNGLSSQRAGGSPFIDDRKELTNLLLQMDVISVPNNTLVVAYNDSPNKRSPLRLSVSTDGGLTWTRSALIEDDPEGSFHYPALMYDAKKVHTEPATTLPIP